MFRVCYLLAVFWLIATTVRVPGAHVSVSDAFLLTSVGIWMWQCLQHNGGRGWNVPRHPLWWPAALILVGGLASTVHAVEPVTSLLITIKIGFVLTLWVSMTMVMVRRGNLPAILRTFIAAVTVTSLIGIHDRITGADWGGIISGRADRFWNRMDATTGHPNELAFLTSVAIPLSVGLLFTEWQRRRWRWSRVVPLSLSAGLNASTLLFAGSVAGWVSAVFSVSILLAIGIWPLIQRAWPVILWCTSAIALTIGIWTFGHGPSQPFDAVSNAVALNLERVSGTTGPGRWRLLQEAGTHIAVSPWIGAGMDQTGTGGLSGDQLVTQDRIHNTLISGWMSGGILTFVGLAWAYAIVVLCALKALALGMRRRDWIPIALGACTLGWILFDQTQPNLYHRFTWMTAGLLFGLGVQVRWAPGPVRAKSGRASNTPRPQPRESTT